MTLREQKELVGIESISLEDGPFSLLPSPVPSINQPVRPMRSDPQPMPGEGHPRWTLSLMERSKPRMLSSQHCIELTQGIWVTSWMHRRSSSLFGTNRGGKCVESARRLERDQNSATSASTGHRPAARANSTRNSFNFGCFLLSSPAWAQPVECPCSSRPCSSRPCPCPCPCPLPINICRAEQCSCAFPILRFSRPLSCLRFVFLSPGDVSYLSYLSSQRKPLPVLRWLSPPHGLSTAGRACAFTPNALWPDVRGALPRRCQPVAEPPRTRKKPSVACTSRLARTWPRRSACSILHRGAALLQSCREPCLDVFLSFQPPPSQLLPRVFILQLPSLCSSSCFALLV